MRILSIDLPWSESGVYGFAFVDLGDRKGAVSACEVRVPTRGVAEVFHAFARERERFDVILADHPIGDGGAPATGYRPVERAVSNSAFAGRRRIQCPRFQPGAQHMAAGLRIARIAQEILGSPRAVIVESFPQLSVPSLLEFAEREALPSEGILRLNSHKSGPAAARGRAQHELIGAFARWTGRRVDGLPTDSAGGDGLDAVIGLLPALQLLDAACEAPGSAPWAEVVWLYDWPFGTRPLPGGVARSLKAQVRAQWMNALRKGAVGPAGVRVDGVLSMRLPGWAPPAGEESVL